MIVPCQKTFLDPLYLSEKINSSSNTFEMRYLNEHRLTS